MRKLNKNHILNISSILILAGFINPEIHGPLPLRSELPQFLINGVPFEWEINQDTCVDLIQYASSQEQWKAVQTELEYHHKNGGYFAPPIILKDTSTNLFNNCYSTAAGFKTSYSCPAPGLFEEIATRKLVYNHYKDMKELAVFLKKDGISTDIPDLARKNHFPIIAFIGVSDFHFSRPTISSTQKESVEFQFSEQNGCMGDIRNFCTFKEFKENYTKTNDKYYKEPTVFYVPKKYLTLKAYD